MAKRDYYEVLGVNRDASDADLKGSYRKLAMKWHPDRNPDNPKAEEHFKEAKEAYEVLTDPKKRPAYDQFGHAGVSGPAGGGPGFNADIFADFSDILGDFFGFGGFAGGRRGGAVPRTPRPVACPAPCMTRPGKRPMDALKHPGSPGRIRKLVIRIPPYVPAPQTRRSAN